MFLFRILVLAECFLRFHYKLDYFIHAFIERFFVKLAAAYGGDELLGAESCRAGHFEVLSGGNALGYLVFRAPVGDDNTVKAPLLAKNMIEKPFVFGAVCAV